jgi:protein-S-isoprenylcysteine O-methyltransferase Ste14
MKKAPPVSVGARGTCRLDRLRKIRALMNNDDKKVSHASIVHLAQWGCQTSQSFVSDPMRRVPAWQVRPSSCAGHLPFRARSAPRSARSETGSRRCRKRGIPHSLRLGLILVRPLLRFWPDLRSRIGVYILVLVLTLLANGIQLVVPMITGYIIDGPIAHRDLSALWLPVLGVLAIGVAEAVGMWARRMIVAPVVSGWEIMWRARLFDRLQYTSVADPRFLGIRSAALACGRTTSRSCAASSPSVCRSCSRPRSSSSSARSSSSPCSRSSA